MSYDFIDPKYWFDRAEEVRIRSDLMRDPGNRETMLRIAADYERLGQRAVIQAKRSREGHGLSLHPHDQPSDEGKQSESQTGVL